MLLLNCGTVSASLCVSNVQVTGVRPAVPFMPRTASNVVRAYVRKSITKRPSRAQKKTEPGESHLLLILPVLTDL